MSYLVIFGKEFSKTILIFKTTNLKFAKLQSFAKKKSLNFEPKMSDLGIFELKF